MLRYRLFLKNYADSIQTEQPIREEMTILRRYNTSQLHAVNNRTNSNEQFVAGPSGNTFSRFSASRLSTGFILDHLIPKRSLTSYRIIFWKLKKANTVSTKE